jgi:hypothetical protein
MARVGRRKAPILTNDNPMLPFAWEEIAVVECVPAPVVKPALVPKPRPNPATAPVLSRRPVPRSLPSTPFGTWLLAQTQNDGWIGDLAKAAKADRAFPRGGDADAVRQRLSLAGAEADMVEAVDAAELAWLTV